MQYYSSRSGSAELASGRLPRAVAIACEGRLEREVLDVVRPVDGMRVTACSGFRHLVDLCSSGEYEVGVLDLDHLRIDGSKHDGLGKLIGRDTRLVLVSSAVAPAGLDVTRMQWLQRPVSAEHLVFTLRSLTRRA